MDIDKLKIEIGDKAIFELENCLEIITNEEFKSKNIIRSENCSDRSITATIKNYYPKFWRNLEIEAVTEDNYKFKVNLSQCKNIRIVKEMDYLEE